MIGHSTMCMLSIQSFESESCYIFSSVATLHNFAEERNVPVCVYLNCICIGMHTSTEHQVQKTRVVWAGCGNIPTLADAHQSSLPKSSAHKL